jgi:hypothetical protein
MEGLTRLVTESLARHGFDRPLDYRRLHWSRWFRCDSHHSLLFVPSKPGVFAIAEEIMDLGSGIETAHVGNAHVGTDAFVRPATLSEAQGSAPLPDRMSNQPFPNLRTPEAESRKPEARKRMLAVTQFFEDDDMAFVLDRMLSRQNPMASRLASGRYFVRFVVVEDLAQRRSICSALNQWMASASETATGIGPHFATSLELTPATEFIPQPDDRQQSLFPDVNAIREGHSNREGHDFSRAEKTTNNPAALAAEGIGSAPSTHPQAASPQLDSGAATNIHCPTPIPSGF